MALRCAAIAIRTDRRISFVSERLLNRRISCNT